MFICWACFWEGDNQSIRSAIGLRRLFVKCYHTVDRTFHQESPGQEEQSHSSYVSLQRQLSSFNFSAVTSIWFLAFEVCLNTFKVSQAKRSKSTNHWLKMPEQTSMKWVMVSGLTDHVVVAVRFQFSMLWPEHFRKKSPGPKRETVDRPSMNGAIGSGLTNLQGSFGVMVAVRFQFSIWWPEHFRKKSPGLKRETVNRPSMYYLNRSRTLLLSNVYFVLLKTLE